MVVGMFIGAQIAGMVYNSFLGEAPALDLAQWKSFWFIPAGFAVLVAIFFALTFKEAKEEKE